GTEGTACLRWVLASWRLGVEEWVGASRAVVVLNAKAQKTRKGKGRNHERHGRARRERPCIMRRREEAERDPARRRHGRPPCAVRGQGIVRQHAVVRRVRFVSSQRMIGGRF